MCKGVKKEIKEQLCQNGNNLLEYNKWYIFKNEVMNYGIDYEYEKM